MHASAVRAVRTPPPISVSGACVFSATWAGNLGITLSSFLSLSFHIQTVSKCSWRHFQNASRIQPLLSTCTVPTPVQPPLSPARTITVASFLVSPPPALPLHCPLSTRSQGDPIITAVGSCHCPILPCLLGIKHQLLSRAWPTLLLRPHLPSLSSGSPRFHHTGLLTVPPPCAGHTSTSGPSQILFPVPGTLPADTYLVRSLIQVSAQGSPPQGDPPPDDPCKTTAPLHMIPSPYSVTYFLSVFPLLKCQLPESRDFCLSTAVSPAPSTKPGTQ